MSDFDSNSKFLFSSLSNFESSSDFSGPTSLDLLQQRFEKFEQNTEDYNWREERRLVGVIGDHFETIIHPSPFRLRFNPSGCVCESGNQQVQEKYACDEDVD